MNTKKIVGALLAATVLLLCSSLPVYAASGRGGGRPSAGHHGGSRHGSGGHVAVGTRVFIGTSLWWGSPFWWGAPYPYYPYYVAPPPVVQQSPPVYVQPEPQQPSYWYYCQNPQGYYPYVQQCPGGWMTVVPPSAPPAQ